MLPYCSFPLRSFEFWTVWDFGMCARFRAITLVSTGHVEFAFFAGEIIEVSGRRFEGRKSGTNLAELACATDFFKGSQ